VKVFFQFCQTTPIDVLDFFVTGGMHKFLCNPQKFYISVAFFGRLAVVSPELVWVRAALLMWQLASDRDSECIIAGNKYLADAVKKSHFVALQVMGKAQRALAETLARQVLTKYTSNNMHAPREMVLKLVGTASVRIAKLVTSTKQRTEDEFKVKLTDVEQHLRDGFGTGIDLPPVVLEPSPLERVAKKAKTASAYSASPSEMPSATCPSLTFKEGALVENAVSKARAAKMFVQSRVVLKRCWRGRSKGLVGVVESVHEEGLEIKWMEATECETVPAGILGLAPAEAAKKVAEEPAKELPEGFGFKLASAEQSAGILVCWAKAGLYKIHVSAGSGPEVLCLVREPTGICVRKTVPKNGLVIIPFSGEFALSKPKGVAAKVTITLQAAGSTTKSVHSLWALPCAEQIGDPEADPPVLPTVLPFWWLQNVAPKEGAICLKNKATTVSVPLAAVSDLPAFRKASSKLSVSLTFSFFTNEEEVVAGTFLLPPASGRS